MNAASVLWLSVGVAMDAAAVAAVRGSAVPKVLPRHMLRVALFFGGFQALMPLLGWLVGANLGQWLTAWDHWIAFAILSVLGVKMLWEARGAGQAVVGTERELFGARVLLGLAIATSVDALAVGVTLPLMNAPVLLTVLCMGVTTAILSVLGLFAGRAFGAALGGRLDVLGGVALVALGTKVLVTHLMDH
jgi:manganese efflux pump family protein